MKTNKKDLFKCPICNVNSHWGDWDYTTGKDQGVEIPSLGFDSVEYEYKCPECGEYSPREAIETEEV